MATFFELPLANDFPYFVVNSSGASVPASGYKLFLYTSGTTTKITSYTDSTGGTPNANPVLLGSTGLPQSGANVVGIWLAQSQTVKAVFAPSTDTDPPSSPIWTRDFGANPPGVNDPTNITASSEWIQGTTPTFISATSFSVTTDQTAIYQVGRRTKTINSGGTIYSRITASSFGGGVTTVTVKNDSGVLDSGLSSVSYGLLSATNQSIPSIYQNLGAVPAHFSLMLSDGMTITRATADQNIASQQTLQSATNMSQAIAANEEWVFDCFWDIGATLSGTGIRIGVNAPGGATANLVATVFTDLNAAGINSATLRTTSLNTALDFTTGILAAVGNGFAHISAWVLNGATPGTVQFQFCQSSSSVTNVTVRKGSHMIPMRIGG